jgi:small subunit ribosomal protein S11
MSEEKEKPAASTAPTGAPPATDKKTKAPKARDAAASEGKPPAKGKDPKDAKDATPAAVGTEGKDAAAAPAGGAATSPTATAKDLLTEDLGAAKVKRIKGSKNITHGVCHILATFNNTKVTFSDLQGNVISWSSSGKCNFRGSRKSTAYAAQVVTQDAGRAAIAHGVKDIIVKVRGPGLGRDSAVRALQALGLTVSSIFDVTPVPHNGCRPPKRRRV